MTTEELRVKLVVDTSDLKNSVSKAKKEINSISDSTKGTTKGVNATTESMEELADTMGQIRSMQVFDLLRKESDRFKDSIDTVKTSVKQMKKDFGSFGEEFANLFSFKDYDVGGDGIKGYVHSMLIDTKESVGSLKTALGSLGTAFKSMGGVAVAALSTVIAKAAALLAIIGSIVGLVRNGLGVSLLAKQTNVLAQQAGMSTDAYQRWAFVLGQVGLQVDDMIGAQQTLLEAQVDVRNGTEDIIAAFRQIGLSEKEVMGLNQQQLFERTVEGLQNVENATERATLAYKLLSEDSKNLAPLLNLTSEEVAVLAHNFNTLNGAMSAGLIETSNRLQSALGNLRAAWQGLKNTLAELVLPVIITVVNWLTTAIYVVNAFVRTLFGLDIAGAATEGMNNAATSVGGYTESIETATGAAEKLKRTLMGFDELNVVSNPNSGGGGSGASAGGGGLGGGFAGGATDGLFNTDKLNLDKVKDFIQKWKDTIQTIGPIALIAAGTIGVVLSLLAGNWIAAAFWAGVAGIGFMAGDSNGLWEKWRQKLEEMNLGFVPICMVGIGAIGAVIALCMGNIPLAVTLASMAGIGLAMGGGSDIKNLIQQYEKEIQGVIAPSMIAVGAVVAPLALMTGNIPLALAGLALIGGGLALGGLANGSISGFINDYKDEINRAVSIATSAIGVLACIICLLTGNIPGAIAFGVLAGVSIANLATGGTFFEDAVKVIKDMWNGLKDWFNTSIKPVFTKEYWDAKFDTIKQGANDKLNAVKTTITEKWNGIKNWFSSNIAPKFTKQYWLDKFDTMRHGINTKLGEARTSIINGWNNVKAYWNANIAPKFTKQYWLNKFETFRAAISEKLNAARTVVMNGWNNIKAYWNTYIAPKFTKQYWLNKFETIRAGASEKLNAARTTIMNAWNNIKAWFNTNVKSKFTVSYWQGKFNTIKDGAKAAFNGVIAVIEKAVNGIIKKINTLSWKIPDWVPGYGGDKFGFNFKTITIPRLASGGIATRSTLANIGENGREAVLPLDNNTGWMDKLADRIAARQQGPTKIVLKVGEKELGWASINGINQITKQTGELQLVL